MTAFDVVVVVIVLVSIISAAAEGFFKELFSLGGVVLGLLLASWQYARVAPLFEPHMRSKAVAQTAAFLTIFCLVALAGAIVGKVSRWVAHEVGLRWVDRALGATFGFVRGLVVGTAMVLAATSFMPNSEFLAKSELSRYLLLSAQVAAWLVPGELKDRFKSGVDLIRRHRMYELAPTVGSTEEGANSGTESRPTP